MTVLDSVLASASQRAQELPQPQPRLEDWRYVDVKPLSTAPANTDTSVDLAGHLPAEILAYPAAQLDAIDEESLKLWQDDLADTQVATDVASLHDTQRTAQITYSGVQDGPQLLVTGSGSQRYVIRLAAGAVADLIIVHSVAAGQRADIAFDVQTAKGAVLRIDEIEVVTNGQLLLRKRVHAQRDANVSWNCYTAGGELVRHDWAAHCYDEHAEVSLGGASVVTGTNQVHHFVRVHHHAENTETKQLFKAVVNDTARSSFDGLIVIDEGADGSNAEQTSANLSLSEKARIHSRPQLDVHTDDVTAGHGATFGQPDAQELWYLRSRGLSEAQAHALLVRSFAQEVTHECHNEHVRTWCAQVIAQQLTGSV